MPRILLHIGSPKTGTTSLQHWLWAGRDQLDTAGILYPQLGEKVQHHPLSLIPRYDCPPRMFAQTPRMTDASRFELGEQTFASLLEQLKSKDYDTVILSTECLFDELTPERGSALVKRLKEVGRSVEVICYLRDPVKLYLSRTGQRLKSSHLFWPLAAPNYVGALEAFDTADALHVFDHGRVMTETGGDITEHFSRLFLENQELARPIDRRNESLSAEGYDILWSYRSFAHPDKADKFRKDSGTLYRKLLLAEEKVGNRKPLKAHKEVENSIRIDFLGQARVLKQKFGLDISPTAISEKEDCPLLNPTSPGDIFEIDPERRTQLLNTLLKDLIRNSS